MREVDASNAAQLARRAAAKAAAVEDDKVIARFIQEREAREQVTLPAVSDAYPDTAAVAVQKLLLSALDAISISPVGWLSCQIPEKDPVGHTTPDS